MCLRARKTKRYGQRVPIVSYYVGSLAASGSNFLSSFKNVRRKGGKFDHRPGRPKVLLCHWSRILLVEFYLSPHCGQAVRVHVWTVHGNMHVLGSVNWAAFGCVSEKFMRDNIVGTVLVLSLVIWIPLVCVFQSFVSHVI